MEELSGNIVDEKTYSGLFDVNGNEIKVGDRILFLRNPVAIRDMDGLWEANVVFMDGVFTIDVYNDVEQVENPENWEMSHDWIDSRGWAVSVGFGEYGTWNVSRKPLTEIQKGFGNTTEHFDKYYRPLKEKIGWESNKRIINVEIVDE